jgi:hypothetical protein
MGPLQSFEIYKYFRALWTRMWYVSTLPHHLSSRPLTQPLCRLLAFDAGTTADVGPSSPGHLRSDFPLLLGLCIAGSILQTRWRWAATLLSERRFIRKCIQGWALTWEALWPSTRFPNTSSHRRGSVPMSQSCDPCEEIPKSITLSCWGWTFTPLALCRVSIIGRSSLRC